MENNPNKLFDTHYDIIDAVRIRRKSYVWNRQTFLTTHTGGKKETSSNKRVLYVGLTKVQGECNMRKNCQATLDILLLRSVPTCRDAPCNETGSHSGPSEPLVQSSTDLTLTCNIVQLPLHQSLCLRERVLPCWPCCRWLRQHRESTLCQCPPVHSWLRGCLEESDGSEESEVEEHVIPGHQKLF